MKPKEVSVQQMKPKGGLYWADESKVWLENGRLSQKEAGVW